MLYCIIKSRKTTEYYKFRDNGGVMIILPNKLEFVSNQLNTKVQKIISNVIIGYGEVYYKGEVP